MVCSDFEAAFTANGSTFPCFVSRADPTLVVSSLDLESTRRELLYCLAVPVPCIVCSLVYLAFAYLWIYRDPPEVRVQS